MRSLHDAGTIGAACGTRYRRAPEARLGKVPDRPQIGAYTENPACRRQMNARIAPIDQPAAQPGDQHAAGRFQLVAPFGPAGDQPQAIDKLIAGFESGLAKQTLLGVTGSGKTYTIANVVQAIQKPTLVMAPNKTLAAQLYGEFKAFFPNNAVEYFVSYYDYYQPEAYVPSSDTFIEKRSEEHTSEL